MAPDDSIELTSTYVESEVGDFRSGRHVVGRGSLRPNALSSIHDTGFCCLGFQLAPEACDGFLPPDTSSTANTFPSTEIPPTIHLSIANLGVAKNHLENMGIAPAAAAADDDVLREESPLHSAPLHANKDPIWHVNRDEALRLIRVYQDDMHIMYPLLSIPELVAYANKLFTFMESAQRTGLMMRSLPGADSIDDEETNILKIVMATAMVVEGSGRSELGRAMYAYVQPSIDALLLGDTGLGSVQLLALTV